jgi:hypothetical protein
MRGKNKNMSAKPILVHHVGMLSKSGRNQTDKAPENSCVGKPLKAAENTFRIGVSGARLLRRQQIKSFLARMIRSSTTTTLYSRQRQARDRTDVKTARHREDIECNASARLKI